MPKIGDLLGGPITVKQKKWYQKWWGMLLIIFLVIVIFLACAFAYQFYISYQSIQKGIPNFENINGQTKLSGVVNVNGQYVIIPKADNDPDYGMLDAKVEVIAFEDFQCPYCQQEFTIFRQIMEEYKDRVHFVFRDYAYPPEVHDMAQSAAIAAECADDQGKFWEMHDKIFGLQEQLNVYNLKIWAGQIGLDTEIFNACLDSQKYLSEVEADFRDGQYAGVAGTPTFFINGYRIQGTITKELWEKILDYVLSL